MGPKQLAIDQFLQRRQRAVQESRQANRHCPAGSPMHFYCKECEILIEVIDEIYLFPPYKTCSQCKGLVGEGWLDEAKAIASRNNRKGDNCANLPSCAAGQ